LEGPNTGVVDEEIEAGVAGEFAGGEGADAAEGGEVELGEFGSGCADDLIDAGDGGGALLGIAYREDDLSAFARELKCGGVADAAVSAGDDDAAAGLVGDEAGDLVHGPGVAHGVG